MVLRGMVALIKAVGIAAVGQPLQFAQKAAAKVRQRVVIGVTACCNVAKGNRVVGRPFEFAAGEDACRIALHKNRH